MADNELFGNSEQLNDLISRQAAIDALEKVAELFPWKVPGNRDSYDRYNEAWNDAIGRAEIEIEKLPSAQQWIPVTERLPERNGYYLVTGRQGAVNKRLYQDGYWYGNWTVFAWMPLPKPWEGGQDGTD